MVAWLAFYLFRVKFWGFGTLGSWCLVCVVLVLIIRPVVGVWIWHKAEFGDVWCDERNFLV